MKEVKRRLEVLSLYDCSGIVRHLEAMAQKGWALENISNNVWRYRRTEPRELRYSVVYLPGSSEFDPGPTAENQELQAFCAQAGWVQVASLAQMHIFVNENPYAIPIDTDPALQVDTIHASMKKNFIPSQIAMLCMGLLQIFLCVGRYKIDPIGFLALNANLVSVGCWLMVIFLSIVDLSKYFAWHRKAVEAARDGEFLPTHGSEQLQKATLWVLAVVVVCWVLSINSALQAFYLAMGIAYVGLVFAAVFGVKSLLKKRGASAGTTRTAVWVTSFATAFLLCVGLVWIGFAVADNDLFEVQVEEVEVDGDIYHIRNDELPLYIQDLTDTDWPRYTTYCYETSSLLLTHISTSQDPVPTGPPSLGVNVYEIHFPMIRETVLEEITERYSGHYGELILMDTDIDGAEIYRHVRNGELWNTVLICQENRFILLHPGWELTEQQLRTAIRILAGD